MSRNRVLGWVAALGSIALLAACGTDAVTGTPEVQTGFGQRNGGVSQARIYDVTIYNLTGGQPFTPTCEPSARARRMHSIRHLVDATRGLPPHLCDPLGRARRLLGNRHNRGEPKILLGQLR